MAWSKGNFTMGVLHAQLSGDIIGCTDTCGCSRDSLIPKQRTAEQKTDTLTIRMLMGVLITALIILTTAMENNNDFPGGPVIQLLMCTASIILTVLMLYI